MNSIDVPAQPRSGDEIDEYLLVGALGSGARGQVYRAFQPRFRREVALKLLFLPSGTEDQEIQRFLREIRIGSTLDHPHLVRVLDAGYWKHRHYLVMELVDGVDLAQLIAQRGPGVETEIRSGLAGIADALGKLHSKGIVHRDVKSQNILAGSDGRLRLADLGLALPSTATRVTDSGILVGTPLYMAPEVLEGSPSTSASDVYALGVVLLEWLTGGYPFRFSGLQDMPGQLRAQLRPTLEGRVPPVSTELLTLLHGMLNEAPDRRPLAATAGARLSVIAPGSALAVDRATRPLASSNAGALGEASDTAILAQGPPIPARRVVPGPTGSTRRRPWILGLCLLGVILCLGLAAPWGLRPRLTRLRILRTRGSVDLTGRLDRVAPLVAKIIENGVVLRTIEGRGPAFSMREPVDSHGLLLMAPLTIRLESGSRVLDELVVPGLPAPWSLDEQGRLDPDAPDGAATFRARFRLGRRDDQTSLEGRAGVPLVLPAREGGDAPVRLEQLEWEWSRTTRDGDVVAAHLGVHGRSPLWTGRWEDAALAAELGRMSRQRALSPDPAWSSALTLILGDVSWTAAGPGVGFRAVLHRLVTLPPGKEIDSETTTARRDRQRTLRWERWQFARMIGAWAGHHGLTDPLEVGVLLDHLVERDVRAPLDADLVQVSKVFGFLVDAPSRSADIMEVAARAVTVGLTRSQVRDVYSRPKTPERPEWVHQFEEESCWDREHPIPLEPMDGTGAWAGDVDLELLVWNLGGRQVLRFRFEGESSSRWFQVDNPDEVATVARPHRPPLAEPGKGLSWRNIPQTSAWMRFRFPRSRFGPKLPGIITGTAMKIPAVLNRDAATHVLRARWVRGTAPMNPQAVSR